ncbi:hypothetical protein [Parapedobacter indicus]|uniref:Uncharacterized protein n=1 Tax=Parapedobacter indicus TaxID=1477437 RepID=A0A1I3VDM7_9SPHI|nr:hypothetical protein [Parapedobacter indicus]PPK98941.1 hypothetical protein CLV26_11652 [Parapedobacter indicus]SFJ92251.1 hypothetical protein SAMN05444682_11632 [Parapedobacter indicus]
MKLVQVFVPLTDNDGNRFSESYFETLKSDLNEKFGGVTVYKQMPIEGFWKETEKKTEKDVLAIFEVLVDVMDTPYWKQLKVQLETNFRQKDLLIRYWEVMMI